MKIQSEPRDKSFFFANRDLDLKKIKVIGYDMDYTLIHYHVSKWEERAYFYTLNHLVSEGWPLEHLEFNPNLTKRGLVLDLKRGNILKVDEFGCVDLASHGTRVLSQEEIHKIYASTLIDLRDSSYVFLNTLFSISTGCLYAQLVDELEKKQFKKVLSFRNIFEAIAKSQNLTHLEGKLKTEIISNPDDFVDLDPQVPKALLDQKHAGKKIFLATNSDWYYTDHIMKYAIEPFLPKKMSWQKIFDLIIVAADKPRFFENYQKVFEVKTKENLLRPHFGKLTSSVYYGGCASDVESLFGVSGREVLYVGDHIYSDINIAKKSRRWYTALVLREMEQELFELSQYKEDRNSIIFEKEKKNSLDEKLSHWKLLEQYHKRDDLDQPKESKTEVVTEIKRLEGAVQECDQKIEEKTLQLKKIVKSRWGFLMRVGNSRSLIAKQIARHADIYSARVSSFLHVTPYKSFTSKPALFPHDETSKL